MADEGATGGRRFRHVKRGTSYVEIARADLQASSPLFEPERLVVYRSLDDGKVYCRPASEFDDGRFVEETAPDLKPET